MNKTTIAALILCMALSFNGCATINAKASVQEALSAKSIDDQVVDTEINEDISLQVPKEVQAMFRSCSQLVSYLAVSTYAVDMQNVSLEDYWLIMSLVTYAEKPETVGEFGTIDLEYDVVRDIAEAFFSQTLSPSGMPEPKDIYSASYVPAEKIYELQPVSIGDIVPELISLEQTDTSGDRFLMRIKLVDTKERIKKADWNVSIEAWGDDETHFFPYKFVKAWNVE